MQPSKLRKMVLPSIIFGLMMLSLIVVKGSTSHAQSGDETAAEIISGDSDVYLPIVVKANGVPGKNTGCHAIQTAIDALPDSGGKVVLTTGIFTCTTAIVIDRDNVDVEGQGMSTQLWLADNSNSPVFVLGQATTPPTTTVRNLRIANLTIDGNREAQQHECWGGVCGTGGKTDIRNNGLTLRNVSDVLIEHVAANHNRSGGLVTERDSRRITVRSFRAANNEFDGIAGYLTEDSIFTELYLHDNFAAGMSFDLDFQRNTISDAIVSDNGSVGIFMVDAHNNLFNNIQISNPGQHGLFLAQNRTDPISGASGNIFSNLIIADIGADGWCVDSDGAYAICINNESAANNMVIGAQLFNVDGHCIKEPVADVMVKLGVICG